MSSYLEACKAKQIGFQNALYDLIKGINIYTKVFVHFEKKYTEI